jgi:uncharacterized damage-inducible protein DinB
MNALELFGHWRVVRRGLVEALDQVSDAQLDFVPHEGLWSLRMVALHIAEAEEGWFRHVVTGELATWPQFKVEAYPTVDALKQVLTRVHGQTEAYLATIDVGDLERIIDTPWEEEIPLRWIVWHVLEHEIHHRGEIFLMLGLMDMRAPDV